jgi:DNA polymerase-1
MPARASSSARLRQQQPTTTLGIPPPNEGEVRLVLVDAMGVVHRAFHAIREPLMVRRTGEVTTAVFGFTNTLLTAFQELAPTHVAVCWDAPGPTFRHEKDETYKAQRVSMPDDLRGQISRVRQVVETFGFPLFEQPGYEADDLIGTLARQASEQGIETYVVTLDTDLVQVVGPCVKLFMYRPYQRDTLVYTEESARVRWGFDPPKMVDFKGLKGDTSDNIPGVPGIGEKTAVKLIEEYGGIEGIYASIDSVEPAKLRENLREHEAIARHSAEMARIQTDVPCTLDLEACRLHKFERAAVIELFNDLEFRSLVAKIPVELMDDSELPKSADAVADIDYRVVRTPADLAALAAEAGASAELGYYVLGEGDPLRSPPAGLAVATAIGKAAYIPVGHSPRLGEDGNVAWQDVSAALAGPLSDPAIPKTAHDGKRSAHFLSRQGIRVENLDFDTQIAAFLVGDTSTDLAALARERAGTEVDSPAALIGTGRNQTPLSEVDVEVAMQTAAAYAEIPLRLKGVYGPRLEETGLVKLFREIEMPLVPVLRRMEGHGVKVDLTVLREMSQLLTDDIDRMEREIYATVGHEFTIGSPQQLSHILFTEIGLPKTRKMATGWATDVRSLEPLREVHPIIGLVLDWRQLTKLKSTYLDALPGMVNPATGRIHTNFNQTVAATGRLSSQDPNLQNIPIRTKLGKAIRTAFVPDGYAEPVMVAVDYSQIELRVMAHVSRDPGLIAAFQADEDIHTSTAASVYGVPPDAVSSDMRRLAKMVNFGVLYGLTDFGLASRTELTRQEAAQFIQTYYSKFPNIRAWKEKLLDDARVKGYTETLAGRRRWFPALSAPNAQVRMAAEREAVNMPIQGTAADIIKIAMVRLDRAMQERELSSRMLLQVHDELVFEAPRDETDELTKLVADILPKAMDLIVPLKVDVKTGPNWGALEVVDESGFELPV